MPLTTTAGTPEVHALRCMEIWQGSHGVENAVTTPGLDAWVHSRPYQGAAGGGDVHYVSLCAGGVITRLAVADVSGHGAAVAEVGRALRDLMRRHMNRKDQTGLVQALNREFTAGASAGRFATAVVATYLTIQDRLTVCNAGHPRPLWYRAAEGRWAILDAASAGAANLPLGIDEETAYEQFSVALGKDDVLLFYTDALTEARDPADELLGEAGLLRLAGGLRPAEPASVGLDLLAAVAQYRAGAPADDDVTLLVLHHNAGPSRPPSLRELPGVYARVLGLLAV
jgi:sigma-B regulation protein RsbU (phosphoserine phosphatase)